MAELILLVFCLIEAQIAVVLSTLAYLKTRSPEIKMEMVEDEEERDYVPEPANYDNLTKDFENIMRNQ